MFSSSRNAGHRIAGAAGLEVRQRQSEKVTEEACAQFDVDAICRMREYVGAQDGEHGLEDRDADQGHHQARSSVLRF